MRLFFSHSIFRKLPFYNFPLLHSYPCDNEEILIFKRGSVMKKILILLALSLSTSAFADSAIQACYGVGFKGESHLQRCLTSGAKAETIRACSQVGFTRANSLNECIESKESVARIRSCALAGLETASEVNRCIKRTTLRFNG
jgi:hypothetical protein